jgi:hypothetical protein
VTTVRRSVMLVMRTRSLGIYRFGCARGKGNPLPNAQERDAFECLKDDWGQAYKFEYWPGTPKPYRAFRRDDGTELAAEIPDDLRDLIRADHFRSPVPRSAREGTDTDAIHDAQ